MDEPVNDLRTKTIGALLGVLLLGFVAQRAYGDDGLAAVLVLAIGAIALAGFHRLSGRTFVPPAGWRRADQRKPTTRVEDDAWRSERWVREAVERGLRSLDAWRFDQQAT